MQTLSLDIETYSPQDLSKVGVYKYAEDCKVLLVAFAFDDGPVRIVDLAQGEELPFHLVVSLTNPQVMKTAFNAAFELTVLEKYLGKPLDSMQWQCTMVQALSLGLPSSLEQVGKVLNLAADKRKLETGKKLIEYFSKPRKNVAKTRNRRHCGAMSLTVICRKIISKSGSNLRNIVSRM